MTPNILVIGETGQLARALKFEGRRQDLPLLFSDRGAVNLSEPARMLQEALETYDQLGGIILAAAYTDVEGAETDGKTAHAVNGVAPGIIAKFCKKKNIPFVHVSTDYVFDGRGHSPYRPADSTSPINAYGRSKEAGEAEVVSLGANAAILRTSWVYDAAGKNFLTAMLNLAKSKDAISVVSDQIGRPTFAPHLANACLTAMSNLQNESLNEPQIFHVTDVGVPISWADFAEAIFEDARQFLQQVPTVMPILSADYPTTAMRPFYSVLDTQEFEKKFSTTLPTWRDGMKKAVREFFEK